MSHLDISLWCFNNIGRGDFKSKLFMKSLQSLKFLRRPNEVNVEVCWRGGLCQHNRASQYLSVWLAGGATCTDEQGHLGKISILMRRGFEKYQYWWNIKSIGIWHSGQPSPSASIDSRLPNYDFCTCMLGKVKLISKAKQRIQHTTNPNPKCK